MAGFRSTRFFVAACAAVWLPACAGGPSSAPFSTPVEHASIGSRTLSGPNLQPAGSMTIFISDASTNVVYAVGPTGKSRYTLSGFSEPEGLAADADGALYVADTANSRVAVFPNPSDGKPTTLEDPGEYPAGVAVAPVSGIVAATNLISTTGGAGSVSLYARGTTSPCATVASPTHFARTYFAAFDAEGDLFLTGSDTHGNASVGEVIGGCAATHIENIAFHFPLVFSGFVAVNASDRIVFAGTHALYTFEKPAHGSFGKPIATTKLSGVAQPSFAFASDGSALWALDGSVAGVAEFAYPAGGAPIHSFALTTSQPIGIAFIPATTP